MQERLQQLLNVAENNISSFGGESFSSFEESKMSSFEEDEEVEDKGAFKRLKFSRGNSSEFLYRLIMQAKRIKRKLNREELRKRQEKMQDRARAPVRGEVIEPPHNMQQPIIRPEPILQQMSNRWIKMDEYEKNEHFLNASKMVYIKANAVAAVEAATRAVVGMNAILYGTKWTKIHTPTPHPPPYLCDPSEFFACLPFWSQNKANWFALL